MQARRCAVEIAPSRLSRGRFACAIMGQGSNCKGPAIERALRRLYGDGAFSPLRQENVASVGHGAFVVAQVTAVTLSSSKFYV